jgi:hypothetical protein
MKISSFNPLIVSKDAEPIIKLFEEMGFERHHNIQANTGGSDFNTIRMKNPDGFYVDVANVPNVAQDMSLIRMNVDDFDEALEFLTARGFKNKSGKTVDTKSNKSAMIVSPSGFAFDLCQHIKDHD